ncbi:MAG: methyltransferase [Gammaproteobacteria bacterium]|nr:methyltransferase [Gammaproteobacteria bacterium]
MLVPQGEFELKRVPHNSQLQAWDAADLYLLRHLDEARLLPRQARVMLINDNFGALSVALADYHPTLVNDSHLAELALSKNLRLNGYGSDLVGFNSGIDLPAHVFDLILIKVPKSLALLEHQLYTLRRLIGIDSKVIAAGMSRSIHSSTLNLFDSILGPTTTTLAWKKARLIQVSRDQSLNQGQSPYPDCYAVEAGREFTIYNFANLFSREGLDKGSRLLIENMPVSEHYQKIADLGCGNGVLGLIAASLNLQAELLFTDESYSAIASAQLNFESAYAGNRKADFRVTDCLQGVVESSIDLVLNNPPFHQQNSLGDSIAWQMFVAARKVLQTGGELWVVGNRHLAYHAKLKKIFGNCAQVASNPRFVVLKAIKR